MDRSFWVAGLPRAKGSTRAFVVKGKAITTSTSRGLPGWQTAIANEARANFGQLELQESAIALVIAFILPKPKSYPKKDIAHITKPDLDKLVRSCMDALKGVIYKDDSQVVSIEAGKVYQSTPNEQTGVRIRVITDA